LKRRVHRLLARLVQTRQTREAWRARASSCLVVVDERVAAQRVDAIVLVVQVHIESTELFPLDNGKRCVQRIQVSDLDVGVVNSWHRRKGDATTLAHRLNKCRG